MTYDSTEDTKQHIRTVASLINIIISHLITREKHHDESKLSPPEKETYDKYTPLLSAVEYGSDEYKQYLSEMGEALQHHYEHNRHHPDFFSNGISGMNLIDLIELFCDWKAATLRVKNGNFEKSIEYNIIRFRMGNQLASIFMNTARDLDW